MYSEHALTGGSREERRIDNIFGFFFSGTDEINTSISIPNIMQPFSVGHKYAQMFIRHINQSLSNVAEDMIAGVLRFASDKAKDFWNEYRSKKIIGTIGSNVVGSICPPLAILGKIGMKRVFAGSNLFGSGDGEDLTTFIPGLNMDDPTFRTYSDEIIIDTLQLAMSDIANLTGDPDDIHVVGIREIKQGLMDGGTINSTTITALANAIYHHADDIENRKRLYIGATTMIALQGLEYVNDLRIARSTVMSSKMCVTILDKEVSTLTRSMNMLMMGAVHTSEIFKGDGNRSVLGNLIHAGGVIKPSRYREGNLFYVPYLPSAKEINETRMRYQMTSSDIVFCRLLFDTEHEMTGKALDTLYFNASQIEKTALQAERGKQIRKDLFIKERERLLKEIRALENPSTSISISGTVAAVKKAIPKMLLGKKSAEAPAPEPEAPETNISTLKEELQILTENYDKALTVMMYTDEMFAADMDGRNAAATADRNIDCYWAWPQFTGKGNPMDLGCNDEGEIERFNLGMVPLSDDATVNMSSEDPKRAKRVNLLKMIFQHRNKQRVSPRLCDDYTESDYNSMKRNFELKILVPALTSFYRECETLDPELLGKYSYQVNVTSKEGDEHRTYDVSYVSGDRIIILCTVIDGAPNIRFDAGDKFRYHPVELALDLRGGARTAMATSFANIYRDDIDKNLFIPTECGPLCGKYMIEKQAADPGKLNEAPLPVILMNCCFSFSSQDPFYTRSRVDSIEDGVARGIVAIKEESYDRSKIDMPFYIGLHAMCGDDNVGLQAIMKIADETSRSAFMTLVHKNLLQLSGDRERERMRLIVESGEYHRMNKDEQREYHQAHTDDYVSEPELGQYQSVMNQSYVSGKYSLLLDIVAKHPLDFNNLFTNAFQHKGWYHHTPTMSTFYKLLDMRIAFKSGTLKYSKPMSVQGICMDLDTYTEEPASKSLWTGYKLQIPFEDAPDEPDTFPSADLNMYKQYFNNLRMSMLYEVTHDDTNYLLPHCIDKSFLKEEHRVRIVTTTQPSGIPAYAGIDGGMLLILDVGNIPDTFLYRIPTEHITCEWIGSTNTNYPQNSLKITANSDELKKYGGMFEGERHFTIRSVDKRGFWKHKISPGSIHWKTSDNMNGNGTVAEVKEALGTLRQTGRNDSVTLYTSDADVREFELGTLPGSHGSPEEFLTTLETKYTWGFMGGQGGQGDQVQTPYSPEVSTKCENARISENKESIKIDDIRSVNVREMKQFVTNDTRRWRAIYRDPPVPHSGPDYVIIDRIEASSGDYKGYGPDYEDVKYPIDTLHIYYSMLIPQHLEDMRALISSSNKSCAICNPFPRQLFGVQIKYTYGQAKYGTRAGDYKLNDIDYDGDSHLKITLVGRRDASKVVTVTIKKDLELINVQRSVKGKYENLFIGTVAIHNADITIVTSTTEETIQNTKVKLAITEPSETTSSMILNDLLFAIIRQHIVSDSTELIAAVGTYNDDRQGSTDIEEMVPEPEQMEPEQMEPEQMAPEPEL